MSTYLKHMDGYKQSQLKNKSFAKIQKLFDRSMTRVNMFVDMDTELVKESSKKDQAEMAQESSSKRAGDDLEQEKEKKQKIDDDQEEAEMKKLIEVVLDEEEVAIDAIPLATKPPSIMLRDFDRKDLETLWKLVKAKYGSTRPEDGYESTMGAAGTNYNCLFRVNVAGTKLQLLKVYNCSRIKTAKKIKIDWRSRILT
ncbi:hypothetical protein Tco_0988890 [Tanacetum coccineum]|uniref:Uncharacterized protein n=1 Tax=Tanacetum coccineum TaxID=301880 RepID=A0ABQ5ES65_9ASTR